MWSARHARGLSDRSSRGAERLGPAVNGKIIHDRTRYRAFRPGRCAPADTVAEVGAADGETESSQPERKAVIDMAGMYQTTPEEMQRAAAQVQQVNDQVQARLSQLRNQLAPLAGAWQGEAATAFHGLMERWNTDAAQLSQALRGIGEAIQTSGRSYQQAEESQQQSMSSITSALG